MMACMKRGSLRCRETEPPCSPEVTEDLHEVHDIYTNQREFNHQHMTGRHDSSAREDGGMDWRNIHTIHEMHVQAVGTHHNHDIRYMRLIQPRVVLFPSMQ